MADFGLTIKVTEGSNDGPAVSNATASGTLMPAVSDVNGNAVIEGLLLTVEAPGYASYAAQPYNRPSLQAPVTVSLQKLPPVPPKPPHPPFAPAPRFWVGNMCGTRVEGLPAVAGGGADDLVISWFYDRYDDAGRAAIRADWKTKKLTHVVLSWPDSRSIGQTPQQFQATCYELIDDGFCPCPFLSAKGIDSPDVPSILAGLADVLPLLIGVVPAVCIGFELSLWLTPTQTQQLIDAVAPQFVAANTPVYVHFQAGYLSFPQPGADNASFWQLQVGKLTGVLAQKVLTQPNDQFAGWIGDCLSRMAGNDFMPTDSGFGHPFDFVMLEITAEDQLYGKVTEEQGNALGDFALSQPAVTGPAGTVSVMGSGNGRTQPT